MDIQKQTKMAEMLTKIKARSDKCKQDLEDRKNGKSKVVKVIQVEVEAKQINI